MLQENYMQIIGQLYSFIIGLCIGSFLNVVIYRLIDNESLIKKGSHCKSCGANIRWYDNIPVISWIHLRGKCKNCKSLISVQYPLVEFITGMLFLFIFRRYNYSLMTLNYFLLVSLAIAIAVIDLKTFEICPILQKWLVLNGLFSCILDYTNALSHIVGAISISLFLSIFYYATQGKGLGFGDVKLMFLMGLVLGIEKVWVGFILGCIIAIVVHYLRMGFTGVGNKLAFAPYLCLGSILGLFLGQPIVEWYFSLIGVVV